MADRGGLQVEYATFFDETCGFPPFPYQAALGEEGLPEVLAVPTGFGKTEAVVTPWLHAHAIGAPDTTRGRGGDVGRGGADHLPAAA